MDVSTRGVAKDCASSVRLHRCCAILVLRGFTGNIGLILVAEDDLSWLEYSLLKFAWWSILDMFGWICSLLLFSKIACSALDCFAICFSHVFALHAEMPVSAQTLYQCKSSMPQLEMIV